MRTRLLITAVALASVFCAQQAVAKSSTSKTHATNKKHHKKHHMKKSAAPTINPFVNA